MSKAKIIGISLIILGLVIVTSISISRFISSRRHSAGLKVDTTPPSLVFVDDVQVGRTPISEVYAEGEVNLKIVPDSTSSAISPFATKVRLTSNTYTSIKRDFGESDSVSAGEVVSLHKISDQSSSINIISTSPESTSVVVDGRPQGFTPLPIATITPGDHEIELSSPGYLRRSITVKAVSGYQLTIIAKLAAIPTVLIPTPTPTLAVKSSHVVIQSTPTGFLRVRSAPSVSASELGQIKPGESYAVIKSQPGWFLIQAKLDSTASGWISSQYAKVYE